MNVCPCLFTFSEIYRILSHGGATYIGGGFGARALEEEITWKMRKLNPLWNCNAKIFQERGGINMLDRILEEIAFDSFTIINDESFVRVVLSKPHR
jgi:hypothetical protein